MNLTQDNLPVVAKVPNSVNVEYRDIEKAPAKDLIVFIDAENPLDILSHPVLGPVLTPFKDFLFKTEGGKTTLVANPTRLPLTSKIGSLETICLATGGNLSGNAGDDDFDVAVSWRNAGAKVADVLSEVDKKEGGGAVAIMLGGTMYGKLNAPHAMKALGRALGNVQYNEKLYKSSPEGAPERGSEVLSYGVRKAVGNVYLVGGDQSLVEGLIPEFQRGDQLSRMQALTRFLAEAPHNLLDCETFANTVYRLYKAAKEADPNLNVKMDVWGPAGQEPSWGDDGAAADIQYHPFVEKEMKALRAVHAGSGKEKGPYKIELSYENDWGTRPVNIIVGKTIVMDNGGHCAKGGAAHDMQADMQGGATTAALFAMAAENKLEANMRYVFAVASNDADADAFEVNDVLTHDSGVTTNIINTDAEGRLVLADALSSTLRGVKAAGKKVGSITTIATLTGHALIVSGNAALAISSNTKARRAVEDAAKVNGEGMQGEELKPVDFTLIEDERADIKNLGQWSVGPTNARGAQSAAAYIQKGSGLNKEEQRAHMHFDIAPEHTTKHATGDVKKWPFNAGASLQTIYDHSAKFAG